MAVLQAIVEVAGLEVMRHTGELGAGDVVQVSLLCRELRHHLLQPLGLSVIQHNDLELVLRVVLVAGSADRIHDHLIVLAAAGDEHVHSWHIVTKQPQLGPAAALGSPHGPDVVQHRRHGDGDFDAEEYPGLHVGLFRGVLGGNHAHNAQDQVQDVEEDVEQGKEGDHEVQVALPSFPGVCVIAIVEALNLARLREALGEGW